MANNISTSVNSQLSHMACYSLNREYFVALGHTLGYAAYISSYFCASRVESHHSMLLPLTIGVLPRHSCSRLPRSAYIPHERSELRCPHELRDNARAMPRRKSEIHSSVSSGVAQGLVCNVC